MSRSMTLVGLVGGGDCSAEDVLQLAEQTGTLLAQKGFGLICGGMGGVMEAACRGADQAGGVTIGILPGDNPEACNPYVQIPIATGLGHARNALIASAAAGLIAIGGEYGTLSEVALGLAMNKPVVVLGRWNSIDGVKVASTPKEAVSVLLSHMGAA